MTAIERAQLDDAAEILALQKLAYQSEAAIYDTDDIPPLTQTLAEMEADLERQTVLVARETGPAGPAIVGSVRAHAQDGTCHVGRLIVHPDRQNRGLGTRLLELLVGMARDGGYRRLAGLVHRDNGPMLAVLAKFGATTRTDGDLLRCEIEL